MIPGSRGQIEKDLEIGATVRMLGPGVLLYELAWVVDFLFVYSRNLIDYNSLFSKRVLPHVSLI